MILAKIVFRNESPGGTPYIRMIGMIVVFLGVEIGNLVFFRGCSSEILEKDKTGIC